MTIRSDQELTALAWSIRDFSTRTVRQSFAALILSLSVATTTIQGQAIVDHFDPNAEDRIRNILVEPNGQILISGDFFFLNPAGGEPFKRIIIARLNEDGTVDPVFNPQPNGGPWLDQSLALQSDGKILYGGNFTTIGTQTRRHLARIEPVQGNADSFNPSPDGEVFSVAVQPDGKILVGGHFTQIGGQARNNIARLDPVTGLADSFDPNASSIVYGFSIQPDGKVLAFGGFGHIGGQTRSGIARLDPTTGQADSFNAQASGGVFAMALQPDGKILVGGTFNSIGGQTRHYIARLDPITALADSFNPDANGSVLCIALEADGRVLAAGRFSIIGGQRRRLAELEAATGMPTSFAPDLNEDVWDIAVQADGKILVGGDFTVIDGTPRNHIARFLAPAAPTPTPTPAVTPTPTASPSPDPAAQFLNLSTRMRVETGDNVGVGGFVITGSAPKRVLLRGIGPFLTGFGVPDALADPVMNFGTITNDNWRDTQEAEILATGIPPTNNLESAIIVTLNPGQYTAILSGKNNTSGVALIEVYDLDQAAASKLANISTRALVGTGSNVVIAGFVLGNGTTPDNVIVRGIGPSLAGLGVPNALANPTLELRDQNGTLLRADDNWQDDPAQAAIVNAAGLAPTNNLESAIAATLAPGQYTALLAGLNNGTGVGLVEVYDLGSGTPGPNPTANSHPFVDACKASATALQTR